MKMDQYSCRPLKGDTQEGCIGFGIPRDPTLISWERAVLSLLWAGVGGQNISLETRGERWVLACIRNGAEKKHDTTLRRKLKRLFT